MGTSTAMTIATMNAANSRAHYHHHSDNEGTQLLAVLIALIILPVLWIVFTSIRQLIRKDKYYEFVEDNAVALFALALFGGFTLFILFVSFIYTLIQ
jgi:queuine/archaeosine tRNA-ribosyltransferase